MMPETTPPPRPCLLLPDQDATERLGAVLALHSRPGDVIALWGDLGAGKSTLARAFVRALTSPDEDVPSPTYTLVQTYEPRDPARALIWHFDFYRLEDPDEAPALDIDDAFCLGVSLLEWPGQLGPHLPSRRLDIVLDLSSAGTDNPGLRTATLEAHGASWVSRLPVLLTAFEDT